MFNVCFVLRHRQASLHIQYCLGVHIEWIVFVHLFTQTLGFINYKNKCMYYFMLRYSHTVATFSYFYPPSLLHLHLFWLIFEIVILTFTHSDLPVLHYPVLCLESIAAARWQQWSLKITCTARLKWTARPLLVEMIKCSCPVLKETYRDR